MVSEMPHHLKDINITVKKLKKSSYHRKDQSYYINHFIRKSGFLASFPHISRRLLRVPTNEGKVYQKHTPSSYGFVIVDFNEKIIYEDFYRGKDAIKRFISSIRKANVFMKNHVERNTFPLTMTLDDEKAFKEAKKCWLCLGELTTDRVRDHDHFTGKYRGAAHK